MGEAWSGDTSLSLVDVREWELTSLMINGLHRSRSREEEWMERPQDGNGE